MSTTSSRSSPCSSTSTEPREFLREVRRLLKPGGATYLIVPNVDSLALRVLHEQAATFDGRNHLLYFSPRDASRRARARGLRRRRDADAGRVARPGARVADLQRAVQRRGRPAATRSPRPFARGVRTSSGCSRSSTSATSCTASRRSARKDSAKERSRSSRPRGYRRGRGSSLLLACLAAGLLAAPARAEMPRNHAEPEISGGVSVGGVLLGHNGTWLYADGSGCGSECSFWFRWGAACSAVGCATVSTNRGYRPSAGGPRP